MYTKIGLAQFTSQSAEEYLGDDNTTLAGPGLGIYDEVPAQIYRARLVPGELPDSVTIKFPSMWLLLDSVTLLSQNGPVL